MSNSSSSRVHRWRSGLAVAAAAVLSLSTAGVALADSATVDPTDAVNAPNNVQYSGTTSNAANFACSARGQAVPGTITLSFNNTGGNTNHLTAGNTLDVDFAVQDNTPGIDVVLGDTADLTVPTPWTDSSTHTLPIETTVSTSVPHGTYQVDITITDGVKTLTAKYNVQVGDDCTVTSSNTAPSVAFTSTATTSDEGSAASYAFSISDPDASQTWTFASGYPICGTDGNSSDESINNSTKTGSFKCTFPDGPAARTVSVKVTDSAGADSNVATVGATVDNVTPIVTAGTLDLTNVPCKTTVTLSGSSFADPGADSPWNVAIDWGDGSTDTTFQKLAPGSLGDQTHDYVTPGGPYTITVSVTDKDGAEGTDTSSDTVTVNQTYSVDFLPPFDDSTPSGLVVNKMKNGRVVPVKATIYDDCAGAFVTDPTKAVTIKTAKTSESGIGDAIETYADAGQSASSTNLFRWSTDGFWIYNLDSKALGMVVGGNYRIDIYVGAVKATVDDWAVLQPVK
jgi:hypothetical protein